MDQNGNITPKVASMAKKVANDFNRLREALGGKGRVSRYQELDLISISDELDTIKRELIARTDGRPQALDLSDRYQVPEAKRAGLPEDYVKASDERADSFKNWAECWERGRSTYAYLGNREFTREELIALADWIQAAIRWHDQSSAANPGPRKKK